MNVIKFSPQVSALGLISELLCKLYDLLIPLTPRRKKVQESGMSMHSRAFAEGCGIL